MQTRNPVCDPSYNAVSMCIQTDIVGQLTLNTYNKLAGRSVSGLVVHFVSDNAGSLVKVGAWLLADQHHAAERLLS